MLNFFWIGSGKITSAILFAMEDIIRDLRHNGNELRRNFLGNQTNFSMIKSFEYRTKSELKKYDFRLMVSIPGGGLLRVYFYKQQVTDQLNPFEYYSSPLGSDSFPYVTGQTIYFGYKSASDVPFSIWNEVTLTARKRHNQLLYTITIDISETGSGYTKTFNRGIHFVEEEGVGYIFGQITKVEIINNDRAKNPL